MGCPEHRISASWACTVLRAELLLGLPFREIRLCDIYTTQDCSEEGTLLPEYCCDLGSAQQGSFVNL